jgi:hypothetical protein
VPHAGGVSEPTGFPPYEPGSDLAATRSPREAAPGHRLGRAAGVQTRVESQGDFSSETILTVRLVEPGSPRPLEVELRGRTLAGTVRDGDWVEVTGEPGRSGRLEVPAVTNVTTGAEVQAVGSSRTALVVGAWILRQGMSF